MSETDVQTVQITSRFSLPFYPMRPRIGTSIKKLEDLDNLDPDYHWSLKLNGDRVLLGVVNGQTFAANRHGDFFKFKIANTGVFSTKLKGAWLFDGEVFNKNFYPFELIDSPDGSLANKGPEVRAEYARQVCKLIRVDWLFGTPETLKKEAENCVLELRSKPYEGVVGKLKGSRYVPLGSASRDSVSWVKRKWA